MKNSKSAFPRVSIVVLILSSIMLIGIYPISYAQNDDVSPNSSLLRYGPLKQGVASSDLNPPLELVWEQSLGGPRIFGYYTSSPVALNGLLYLGGGDGVYALNQLTGEIIWKYPTSEPVTSSPWINDRILYIGSDDNSLYAIDITTGKDIWTFETGGPIKSSPLVIENTVFFGSDDGNVYALDSKSGSIKWTFKTQLMIAGSPAFAYDTIYIGSWDGNVYALDAETGNEKWKIYTSHGVESSPAISEGIVYIGASYSDRIIALDAFTGVLLWQHYTEYKIISSPAISGSQVFIGSTDNHLYALNAKSGALDWIYDTKGGIAASSPTVSGDVVFIGAENNFMYAVDKTTGELVWSFRASAAIKSTALAHDGWLYITSADNTVYAFTNQDVENLIENTPVIEKLEIPSSLSENEVVKTTQSDEVSQNNLENLIAPIGVLVGIIIIGMVLFISKKKSNNK